VDEVVLEALKGRSMTLRRVSHRDASGLWTYRVTLSLPEGSLTTDVHDHGRALARFFQELADAWRGFADRKEFGHPEGQFSLSCVHDGHGTVTCDVRLGEGRHGSWSAKMTMEFDAGTQLERVASAVESFVAAGA
jgi:Family of unknown function (DUF6228)